MAVDHTNTNYCGKHQEFSNLYLFVPKILPLLWLQDNFLPADVARNRIYFLISDPAARSTLKSCTEGLKFTKTRCHKPCRKTFNTDLMKTHSVLLLLHCCKDILNDEFCVFYGRINWSGFRLSSCPAPLAAFNHFQASQRCQDFHGII